jgi:2-polyprenyl-3-methyl-5-hydroxy-6-metoxy-1,4-benzoquinol methylase
MIPLKRNNSEANAERLNEEKQHHNLIAKRLLSLSNKEFRAAELRALYYHQTFISRIGEVTGKRLLDCGCGDGLMSCYMAWQGAEVWGFDISPGMIEVALRRAKLWGVLDKVHLKAMAFEELTYDDEFFDKAYGNFILHHVDLERAATQLSRVLCGGDRQCFRKPPLLTHC